MRTGSGTASVFLLALLGACEQPPTAPGADVSAQFATTFVIDSDVQGSEAQLLSFDGSLLAYSTAKGSFVAELVNSTVFRNAQINKYPTDPHSPCRQFAIAYNASGDAGDIDGLYAAISGMASNGCLARILTDKTGPSPPPIKSFRPLASF